VFDGDLTYWAKRENKNYSGLSASILKQQDHKCNACGLYFSSGDKVELHHIDGNHDNWKRSNLEALHRHCHQHKPVHGLGACSSKSFQTVIWRLEPRLRNQKVTGRKVEID
jgi:5-methylcytosine-specific restriction endonuclease McrA